MTARTCPGVDPVELRVAPLAHAQPRLKGEQAKREQLEIPLHGAPNDARVPRERPDVQGLAVKEGESREAREVPRRRFGLDLSSGASARRSSRTSHRSATAQPIGSAPIRACSPAVASRE